MEGIYLGAQHTNHRRHRAAVRNTNGRCDCEALTAAARVRVVVGIEPWNAMANTQIVDGGTSETARAMLSRVLQQLTSQTAKRWVKT